MKITLHDIDVEDNIPTNVRMMPEGAMFVLKTPVRFVVRGGALVNLDEIVLECVETPSESVEVMRVHGPLTLSKERGARKKGDTKR